MNLSVLISLYSVVSYVVLSFFHMAQCLYYVFYGQKTSLLCFFIITFLIDNIGIASGTVLNLYSLNFAA